MAETVKVKPTPMQRNRFDVAMELTERHMGFVRDPERLEELFAKYYALAAYCENSDVYSLKNLLDEDLLRKIDK
ncbi:hypothetical protein GCM10009865_47460 [Aeromicrobium ponti]|uniref:Uncharacterized protein n=1 Tax=Cytobacillus oceanisediminis TaxID=665099 RepID=A0A562JCX9_9BACI|nr:hypothetical protein [Cytobacillus oceanisediminis]TWH81011.1 hypothetical protein IQ19_04428 [Cytobacillus oceanisediminis]